MVIYSHSRISAFENCPLKFKFRYIDRIKTETEETVEAFMGKKVHETLEKLYIDKKYQKINTLPELIKHLRKIWRENWNNSIIIVREGLTQSNYRKMAEKYISDYYKRYYPFKEKTISTEERVIINLDKKGNYKLQGYIDRLDNPKDGYYEVCDYKTNSYLKLQEQLDTDKQLALYAIGVKNRYKDAKKIRLKWYFLAFDKVFTSDRTNEELKNLRKDTIELIKRIEKEKKFEPKSSRLCDWCEFRSLCPNWAHLYKLEKKDENEYLKDSGLKLVNKYVELSKKKKDFTGEIDIELDKIKEALVKFSKKEGIDVVFGSNNKIKITFSKNFKFPGKGTEERRKLIETLKKLKKFDEIAVIDLHILNKIIKKETWTKEELKIVKKFAEEEESVRFYASKKK